MNKNYNSLWILLFLTGIIALVFLTRMPQKYGNESLPSSEFSTQRALKHIEIISKEPHFVGSPYHEKVKSYLLKELESMGLNTEVQEGLVLSKWGNLVKTQNLLTRIKGSNNSKALLLLTHYDSAPHSNSYGASDDANGLGVILEGIRTFLHNQSPHKNDIIILFTDGEELGLNGAYAFVSEHEWAKDVGLVINFEARGTSGPSMMLAETNSGNAELIKGFAKAAPQYPVSNSLMYSVYKMLPNDTDLTAFREIRNIPGFNLAYIDDHYHYHTEQDNFENFSPESLEHQATYLMPLLSYFGNADLANLETEEDHVYFNSLFGFIHYSFLLNWPLLIICALFLLGIIGIGIARRVLDIKLIFKGFVPFFLSIILTTALVYLGWEALQYIYPGYKDILHGFTYNGHSYIAAFVLIALSLSLWSYKRLTTENTASYSVAPLLLWLIINFVLLITLPGASFLVIPLLFGTMALGILVFTQKNQLPFLMIFSIPALAIITPFIELFPIGLGLKVLPGSALLTSLLFGLLTPLFGFFHHKTKWAFLIFLVGCGYIVKAHLYSDFEKGKAKQNSLVYFYDKDMDRAFWTTYDTGLDDWTKSYFGKNPQTAGLLNNVTSGSKYNNPFTYMVDAPKKILPVSDVFLNRDTLIDKRRHISLEVHPKRPIQRMDLFVNENLDLYFFRANGIEKINQKGELLERNSQEIISYYPTDNTPLILEFQIDANQQWEILFRESSFDLLQNKQFSVPSRPEWAIPMPFVINNAIMVSHKVDSNSVLLKKQEITDLTQEEIDILPSETNLQN